MSQTVDPKAYYGYLFEADKKPTKVLDALLRAIAIYIIDSIGDKEEKCLLPTKLASFYKAVGGNYDSLFVDVPPPSISWIYTSIGCQHTLQPTNDDFQPPSIPALTIRGFVRWQSIEILLGPEEHVPFLQTAVQNFALKNPDNGEPFPTELPKEAFPLKADTEIEKWHSACAEKLRQEARGDDPASRPELPPRPRVQAGFKHVPPRRPAHSHSHSPGRSPRSRPEIVEYFEPVRPIQFQHVSSHHVAASRPVRPSLSYSPSHRAHQFLAPEADRTSRARRRSFPENFSSPPLAPSPPPPAGPSPNLFPSASSSGRHHSHPRPHRAPSVSTASSDSDEPYSPPPRRSLNGRAHAPLARPDIEPMPAGRLAVGKSDASPSIPGPGPIPGSPNQVRPRRERSDPPRPEHSSSSDERRKSWTTNVPVDLSGKLSPQFLQGVKDIKLPRRRVPRSNSRGANVRFRNVDEVREFHGKDNIEVEEDSELELAPRSRRECREDRSSTEMERRRRRRDRDRDLDTDREVPVRPKYVPLRRSSSHDTPRTDKYSDRDWPRDKDGRRRRIGRDRDRYDDLARGVDARRFPGPDGYR